MSGRWPARTLSIIGAVLLAWGGCRGSSSDQRLDEALQAAHAAARDSTRAASAVEILEAYVKDHPDADGAPQALKQLAILLQQGGDMAGAVARYERILAEFPASDEADESQFMVAFILEEHFGDLDGARRAYQAVIDNYPSSELAANARQLLPHVGRPPEEWVSFQEGDSTASP